MARLGKKPITLPAGITLVFNERVATVTGPKGSMSCQIPRGIGLTIDTQAHTAHPVIVEESKEAQSLLGTATALVESMIQGATAGFTRVLELEGVGYRANLEGNDLVLSLGFSHPVRFTAPQGIAIKVEKNVIEISGVDKGAVGQAAARIRDLKKPEPYKGKGIHYRGEVIRRKAGKKAVASGS